jgi:hypothetical protein
MSATLELRSLFEKDARLVNTYAVIISGPMPGHHFETWLTSRRAGDHRSFTINGEPAFVRGRQVCGWTTGRSPCATRTP